MQQDPSSGANISMSIGEITYILWNPNLHSVAHVTCPYPEPQLSSPRRPDPTNFLTIHFNIMVPSTSMFSVWSISLSFLTKILYPALLSSTRATYSINLILFDLLIRKRGLMSKIWTRNLQNAKQLLSTITWY